MRRYTTEKKQAPAVITSLLCKAAVIAALLTFEAGAVLSAETVAGYPTAVENSYPSSPSSKRLQDGGLIKNLAGAGFDDGGNIRFISAVLPICIVMITMGLWFMKRKIARRTRHLVEENRERRQVGQALRRSVTDQTK